MCKIGLKKGKFLEIFTANSTIFILKPKPQNDFWTFINQCLIQREEILTIFCPWQLRVEQFAAVSFCPQASGKLERDNHFEVLHVVYF